SNSASKASPSRPCWTACRRPRCSRNRMASIRSLLKYSAAASTCGSAAKATGSSYAKTIHKGEFNVEHIRSTLDELKAINDFHQLPNAPIDALLAEMAESKVCTP